MAAFGFESQRMRSVHPVAVNMPFENQTNSSSAVLALFDFETEVDNDEKCQEPRLRYIGHVHDGHAMQEPRLRSGPAGPLLSCAQQPPARAMCGSLGAGVPQGCAAGGRQACHRGEQAIHSGVPPGNEQAQGAEAHGGRGARLVYGLSAYGVIKRDIGQAHGGHNRALHRPCDGDAI